MKTTVSDIVSYLHTIAPNDYQENYDNAGLIVGDMDIAVSGVIVSLDCTEAIINEAIAKGCNLIISHHPIVFRGLKRFNGNDYVERTIISAIKNDINLFAIHTNLDNVQVSGVNTKISDTIGLINQRILVQKGDDHNIGAGMIGSLQKPMDTLDFLNHLKLTMQLNVLKHTTLTHSTINKVAVCGGSGSFLLSHAIQQEADIFITSDFKYHEFFDANGKIIIADIGHYESERFTIDLLYDLISNNFSTFAAHKTKINTNPVKYF